MTPLVFDAGLLARGWLSVFQAAGTEVKDSPFYRRIQVELYDDGIRLTATDREVLLTTWVPRLDREEEEPPAIDEAPKASVVALDTAKRGLGLFKYAYPLAIDEDRMDALAMEASIEKATNEAQGQLPFDDLEGELLVFDLPGRERQRLTIYGGTYPDWRPLLGQHNRKRTTAIALAPPIIERLSALGAWNAGPLVWEFGGINGPARVSIGDGPVVIEGLVMPVRWEPNIDPDSRDEVEAALDQGFVQDVDEMDRDLREILDEGEGGAEE